MMVERDPLSALHEQEKEMVWNLRYECQYHFPQSLPKLISCMRWNSHSDVAQVCKLYLELWLHRIILMTIFNSVLIMSRNNIIVPHHLELLFYISDVVE